MTKSNKEDSNAIFTLGNCLVILYTVGLGVIVAAVLVTANDLETSLKEKQTILDDLRVKQEQLTNNLEAAVAGAEETESNLGKRISDLTRDKASLQAKLDQAGVQLRKTQDELEVCNKNYQHDTNTLQLQITEIKTQMFDKDLKINDFTTKNTELSGLLMTLQQEDMRLKSSNEQLSAEKTELTNKVTNLHQDKIHLSAEIEKLKFALEESEKSSESRQKRQIEEMESLKNSHLADVDHLKTEQMQSLAGLEELVKAKQNEVNSRDEEIIQLNNRFSDQESSAVESSNKLAQCYGSLQEMQKLNEDLQKEGSARQSQLNAKEEEIQVLRSEVAAKENSLKQTGEKVVELTGLLTEQENLNQAISQEKGNLQIKIEELGRELEKTQADAGDCLVKKNEEEVSFKEQISSLRQEKEAAEDRLKEFDLKLSQCEATKKDN